ncbi:MAG: DUF262 domain-containing protein, partial [Fusobacteriaceae bacterium]|nr:DUF262 domain-containing protein [Fusobacteriaceae bacterium]
MDNITFWELITDHKIEIPVIQRDYAQGRDSKKSTSIRTSFIRSIIEALQKNEPLHLNFIYGKIKGIKDLKKLQENKKAIEMMLTAVKGYTESLDLDFSYDLNGEEKTLTNTTFIPLDGQQRLTTLFLFHLYIFIKLGDEDSLKKLLKFTYLIRPSTKQFCEEIIKNDLEIFKRKTFTESVKDSPWFFLYWLKDPTIKGMLTTLDEIHSQCKDFDTNEIELFKE